MDILLRISKCYRRIKKLDLAWEFHDKAYKLHPKSYDMFVNEIELLLELKDYTRCLETCKEGIDLFGDHQVFLRGIQTVFIQLSFVCALFTCNMNNDYC